MRSDGELVPTGYPLSRAGTLPPVLWCLCLGLAIPDFGQAQEGKTISLLSARQSSTLGLTNPLAVRLMNYGPFQDQAWTHLKSIGVHYVFASIPPSGERGLLKKRLADNDLKVAVFRGDSDLGRPSYLDELATQLAVCKDMKVKFLFLSPRHTGISRQTAYERLRRAGEEAQKNGVTIALETHPDLGTNADVQRETMNQVNHPAIRVNFDTGNITYYNQNSDAVRELKKIIDRVATVELKDHNGEYLSWYFPALGKGKVNFSALMGILQEHRFQGPLTLEVEGVAGVKMNETQIKQAIADSVAYIRSFGKFQ